MESAANPVKMRRRQSDAKWRANVASCYETLKLIIPVNKRASRRQISKAKILEETMKHINFLENILTSLLREKARKEGCLPGHIDDFIDRRVAEIKQQFVTDIKQRHEEGMLVRKTRGRRGKPDESLEPLYDSLHQTAQVRSVLHQQAERLQHQGQRTQTVPTSDVTPPKCTVFHAVPGGSPIMLRGSNLQPVRKATMPVINAASRPPIYVQKVFSPRKASITASSSVRREGNESVNGGGGDSMAEKLGSHVRQVFGGEQSVPASPQSQANKQVERSEGAQVGTGDAVVPSQGGQAAAACAVKKEPGRVQIYGLNQTNRQLILQTPEKSNTSKSMRDEDLMCREDMWLSDDEQDQQRVPSKPRLKLRRCRNLRKRSSKKASGAAAYKVNCASGFAVFRKHVISLLESKVKATGFGADVSRGLEQSRDIANLWNQLSSKKQKQFNQLALELQGMDGEESVGSEVSAYLDDLTSDLEICVEALNASDQSQRSPTEGHAKANGVKVECQNGVAPKYEGHEEEEEGSQEQDSQWLCSEMNDSFDTSSCSTASANSDSNLFSQVPV